MNRLHASLTAWFEPMVGPTSAARMASAVIADGDRTAAARIGHTPSDQERWNRRLDYSPSRWMALNTPMTYALLSVGRVVLIHLNDHPDADPDGVWDGVVAERARAGRRHLPAYADGTTVKGRHVGHRPRERFDAIRLALTDPADLWDARYGFA